MPGEPEETTTGPPESTMSASAAAVTRAAQEGTTMTPVDGADAATSRPESTVTQENPREAAAAPPESATAQASTTKITTAAPESAAAPPVKPAESTPSLGEGTPATTESPAAIENGAATTQARKSRRRSNRKMRTDMTTAMPQVTAMPESPASQASPEAVRTEMTSAAPAATASPERPPTTPEAPISQQKGNREVRSEMTTPAPATTARPERPVTSATPRAPISRTTAAPAITPRPESPATPAAPKAPTAGRKTQQRKRKKKKKANMTTIAARRRKAPPAQRMGRRRKMQAPPPAEATEQPEPQERPAQGRNSQQAPPPAATEQPEPQKRPAQGRNSQSKGLAIIRKLAAKLANGLRKYDDKSRKEAAKKGKKHWKHMPGRGKGRHRGHGFGSRGHPVWDSLAAEGLKALSADVIAGRIGLSSAYPHQWYTDEYDQCQFTNTSRVHLVVRLAQLFRFYPRTTAAYVASRELNEVMHNETAVRFLRGLSLAEVFVSLTLRDMLYGATVDERETWFGGGGDGPRPQTEIKQILWRMFSFVGNQLMSGTRVNHIACSGTRAFAWVVTNTGGRYTIWKPNTWRDSIDEHGYYVINICHWVVASPEALIGDIFVHEYIHHAGPKDQKGVSKYSPQDLQLANALNYHKFAAAVVRQQTLQEFVEG